MAKVSAEKAWGLVDSLRDKHSLLIVMQDHPDPDGIAGAAALRRIANVSGRVQCSIAYGGKVGRSENRELMEYLGLNFRRLEETKVDRFDALALVDTQPGTGNNSLPDHPLPDIVIDHHPLQATTRKVSFTDVRKSYGAVSTILFEYLVELGIEPASPLATALLYAIRTDTHDLGEAAIEADRRAVHALLPLANTRMLSAIQRGGVPTSYYRLMSRALTHARMRGSTIVTGLGAVDNADILAEAADLLLRHEDAAWVLSHGVYRGVVWFSLRTKQSTLPASKVAERIAKGIGTGGGHEMAAGGQIPIPQDAQGPNGIVRKIRRRFASATGVQSLRSRSLLNP
jgi:nanoRNase/pAp phosphatase (c-di-AMP/oligoRNAs hydrolase)